MVGRGGIAILTLTVMTLKVVLQRSRLSASIVTMRASVGLLTYKQQDRSGIEYDKGIVNSKKRVCKV